MAETMLAARIHGPRDVRVETVPKPTLAAKRDLTNGHPQADNTPNQTGATEENTWLSAPRAVVEVEWAGICGSDLHIYEIAPIGLPTPENPHPLTRKSLPSIMGHELCGTIVSSHTPSKFPPGTRVMVDPRLMCHSLAPHGACASCDSGRDHMCPLTGFVGYSGEGGGFSEFVVVEERQLYKLPENVGLDVAALCEPLAVAHHAIKTPQFDLAEYANKSALIVGGGPVGYAVLLALRAHGCTKIIVSEPTNRRREVLQKSGLVELVVDPRSESVGDRCREVTGGRGVDIVFECAGVQKGMDAAVDALALSGWIVVVSLWETNITLNFLPFWMKETNITSSFCYNEQDFREVMENVAQDKYPGFEKMITGRIALEDVVTKGFKELIENKDQHVKILVTPKKELLK